jgi:hypothetical protein
MIEINMTIEEFSEETTRTFGKNASKRNSQQKMEIKV